MKVLVYSSLFPNNVWPQHGIFIHERMSHFARATGASLKVVAPVPYYPPIKLGSRWLYSQVKRHEPGGSMEIFHPRYLMTPKVGMTLYGVWMFLSTLGTVRRIRRTFDFDVIDAHYVYPDGFAAALLGRWFNKPVVISARGSDINLYAQMPMVRPLLRFALSHAAGIVAVSDALKSVMVRLGVDADRIAVIPNGVDTQKFAPMSKEEARRRLGLNEGTYLLAVGNLTENKGFHLLIQALQLLRTRQHLTNLSLLIVGDGPMRRELEQLAESLHVQEQVTFAGRVAHEQLHLWYSAADLFCLASAREGWPNVLMEAMACGLPIVATCVGGVPEIVSSEAIGLMTRRDHKDLAQTILQALQRPWRSEVLRQHAASYSWTRVAHELLGLFANVVHQPSPLSSKAA